LITYAGSKFTGRWAALISRLALEQRGGVLLGGDSTGEFSPVARAVINEPDDSRLLKDVMGQHGQPPDAPRDERGRYMSRGRNPTFGRGRDYDLARLRRDRPEWRYV
jgi:hypothetical protein